MQLTLPPVRQFQQAAHRRNGWSDHYGAFHVATAYAGLVLPERYTLTGIWPHGVVAPWECPDPRLMVFNVPQAERKPVWLARTDEAETLTKLGFKYTRAIGLPIAYVPASGLTRVPRSLLIMPNHSLAGWNASDRRAYTLYADEMLEAARDFDHVTVCVSPSCQKNGFWMKEFSERGFKIITGASTDDANALIRMRMLFEQFETMTTNAWGSHVAYALAGGVKVAIHGTRPSLELANLMVDTTWKTNPAASEKLLDPQTHSEERKFLRAFYVPPKNAVADVTLGDWFIGRGQQLTPEQMRSALPHLVPELARPTTVTSAGNTSPHRVLFLAHGPGQVNGPNIWLTRLLPELKARGFAPRVLMFLTRNAPCAITDQLRAAGIPCDTAPWASTEDMVQTILHHIQAKPCDVFVPNLNVQGYFACAPLKAAGIPTIGVLHSDDEFHRDLTDEFIRGQGGRHLSAAVAVSLFQHETLRALEHGSTRIVRAPYGAPVPETTVHHRAKPFRFVYVGRLVEEQKRISDTVRAMITLLQRQPDAEFHLCGDGTARPAVEALIKAAKLGNRLRLLGNLSSDEVRRVLLDSQAMVLLSDYEGIPIALMEAMGCGVVPICTTLRSGIGEIIRDGETGLLVADRDASFIAAAERLLHDPALWARCSAAARAAIQQDYSITANADTWARLLTDLVAQRPAPVPSFTPPAQIALPPVRTNPKGIAREDRRKPAPAPMTAPAPHPFTNPPLEPNNVDLYVVRSTILRAVKNALPHFHGTFLDIGCGVMPYRDLITQAPSRVSRYLGLDLAGSEIYHAKVDLRWDGKTIPLPDASVDTAMATEVLEHCPEPLVVLKEARRVLKSGGTFFFTVPFLWPLHDAPYDFFRYTPFALEKLLAEAGFTDVKLDAMGGWNASLAQMIGLWLKRSPLSPTERNEWAKQLWPIYQNLVATDSPPADPRAGNTMATGWTGLARVPAAAAPTPPSMTPHAVVEPTAEVEPMELPIVLVRSHAHNYSETFLEDHVRFISRNTTLLYGYPFPRFTADGNSMLSPALEQRLQAALRDNTGLTEELWQAYSADLARFLQTCGARVALVETGLMGAFVHEACEQASLPFVVHFHGLDAFGREILERWHDHYQAFFKTAAQLIVVSQAMEAQLVKLGAPADRVVLAPYGVSVAVPSATPAAAGPRFVAVGRFVEKKAPHITLAAFNAIRPQVPHARLVMIGDGPMLNACRAFAEKNQLTEAVTFAGVLPRDEVSRHMAAAGAFVQHSVTAANGDSEGLPLAILEAGAHGLPVISTVHAGIPDAVRDGIDGLLVPEKDVKAMAVAMLRVAQDPTLAARLGASFRERVVSDYSRRVSIERLQHLLLAAAEGRDHRSLPAASEPPAADPTTAALTAIADDRNQPAPYFQLAEALLKDGNTVAAYHALGELHKLSGGGANTADLLRMLEGEGVLAEPVIQTYRRRCGWEKSAPAPRPRRLLIVTNLLPPQEMGGYGRTMWEFAHELVARGHAVKVLTADMPHLVRKPTAEHAAFEAHVDRGLRLFGDWKNGTAVVEPDGAILRERARENHRLALATAATFLPDAVIVGNLDFVGHFFVQELLDQGIPVIHRLGNASPGFAPEQAPKSPLLCLAGCSEWVNENLRSKGYPYTRYAVLPPGSPLTDYFRAFSPQRGVLRIAFAGLLMPYKGAHILIEALRQVHAAGIPFECAFAGDTTATDYVGKLQAHAAQNGFAAQVRFPGFLNKTELAALYARSNVLVFPSVFEEPFGKTQVEAMAAGLLVISSGNGGALDIIRDGETGLFFKNQDARDLAEKLLRAHREPEWAESIAQAGQDNAFRFTTEASVDRLETIVEDMIATAHAAAAGVTAER